MNDDICEVLEGTGTCGRAVRNAAAAELEIQKSDSDRSYIIARSLICRDAGPR